LTPHMHLRGASFDFEAFSAGTAELLLRVKPYDFFWQYTYTLAEPRMLRKGTILKWTGIFDNSRNNPKNPDANAEVTWGEQSWEEMMIGFFDVAVDPGLDKRTFFVRN
ncbi:MAG: thiol-disulfide isomerase, partial [Bryobacteraceae bacterium]|nr:thiol-disulfide isomerase [Bryobacteraceae bacterium]